ncbi:hypothetical protein HMPREF9946_01398 [Acetobacteraceae bacterium AT-5844]|nr:hypothetical protein HMPREF9946_01398 [Acetobacteraceae bacterium AT-5844]
MITCRALAALDGAVTISVASPATMAFAADSEGRFVPYEGARVRGQGPLAEARHAASPGRAAVVSSHARERSRV